MSLCPAFGTCLLLTGLASGALLSLFFSLVPPRQTAVIALSLLFFFAHSGSLIFILFNPSVKPAPHWPGKSVFFYYVAWVAFQIAGCFCMHQDRWRYNLPGYLERWAVAYMVLSWSSLSFALCMVLLIFWLRACELNADRNAMRTAREGRRGNARQEEMVHVEHVEFSQPPPVYKVLPYLESGELKR